MADGYKTGGRQKGTPNKMTAELKGMILEALDNSGGVEYLEQQARDKPVAFLALLGKVLPLQVNAQHSGPDGGPIEHTHRVSDATQRLLEDLSGIGADRQPSPPVQD